MSNKQFPGKKPSTSTAGAINVPNAMVGKQPPRPMPQQPQRPPQGPPQGPPPSQSVTTTAHRAMLIDLIGRNFKLMKDGGTYNGKFLSDIAVDDCVMTIPKLTESAWLITAYNQVVNKYAEVIPDVMKMLRDKADLNTVIYYLDKNLYNVISDVPGYTISTGGLATTGEHEVKECADDIKVLEEILFPKDATTDWIDGFDKLLPYTTEAKFKEYSRTFDAYAADTQSNPDAAQVVNRIVSSMIGLCKGTWKLYNNCLESVYQLTLSATNK